ncbi:Folylpolyglutamate synthase [Forsythia ovata]|uniref:Folylpolyglutamate synthase n=1 Tax=Forsythia ovata TaxID=205694 RepID=A0ABD1WTX6_9LAMI
MDSRVAIEENSQDSRLSSAYDTAMEALSSLITRQKRGDRSQVGGKYGKLDRMLMYVKILGLEDHLANLKIIHVAGTKGKGSTCTFCEAILRECGFRTGLFTSPHLIDVRERFRLDGLDIAEDKFLHYFWECWNQLKENVTDDLPMPPLFQFLTVLAFKIFSSEKIDVAVFEVGIGGSDDSTNVIKDPVVCGISPLGMDHMETLGDTLGLIASHKAGIFKPQVPAFTVPQLSEAMNVLEERANGLMVPLEVAMPLDCKKLNGFKLSLSGHHQFTNAGLAVALCKCWLQRTGNWEKLFQHASPEEEILPKAFLRGLSTAHLSGRAQIVHDSSLKSLNMSGVNGSSSGDLIFYLDGAHSPESMEACASWFSTAVKENNNTSLFSPSCSKFLTMEGVCGNGSTKLENESNKIFKQILLFNCMDVRDPQILFPTLVDTCASSGTYFSKAIFVPSISKYSKVTSASSAVPLDSLSKDLTWQFNLQRAWEKIIHGKDVSNKSLQMNIAKSFPSRKFIHEDISNCSPTDGHFACSVVVSSLPLTINWLRDSVKENPSLRIQERQPLQFQKTTDYERLCRNLGARIPYQLGLNESSGTCKSAKEIEENCTPEEA